MIEYPAQIRALTSLRYLAAVWVAFFHMSHFTRSDLLLQSEAVTAGYLGVDFFFVLSGFVLTHAYRTDIAHGRFDYWDFVAKRLGRVYPMHLLTLVLFVVLGFLSVKLGLTYGVSDPSAGFPELDRGAMIRTIMAHLTLIHAWGATNGLMFNGPSWSISAEWFAYLMFPVYMLFLHNDRIGVWAKLGVALLAFLGLFAVSAVAIHTELTRMSWNIGLLRIGPEFLIGVALYGVGSHWTAGLAGARVGMILSCVVILASLALRTYHGEMLYPSAALTVLGLAGVVFFAADGERHGAFKSLGGPILVHLGEISYSVYMLHLFVAIGLFELLMPWLRPANDLLAIGMVVGGVLVATALAWTSYKFVEVPARRAIVGWARGLNGGSRVARAQGTR